MRMKRQLNQKLRIILKEIIIYGFFLVILYTVSFGNSSNSAFQYNQLFINSFVQSQNKNETSLSDVN